MTQEHKGAPRIPSPQLIDQPRASHWPSHVHMTGQPDFRMDKLATPEHPIGQPCAPCAQN